MFNVQRSKEMGNKSSKNPGSYNGSIGYTYGTNDVKTSQILDSIQKLISVQQKQFCIQKGGTIIEVLKSEQVTNIFNVITTNNIPYDTILKLLTEGENIEIMGQKIPLFKVIFKKLSKTEEEYNEYMSILTISLTTILKNISNKQGIIDGAEIQKQLIGVVSAICPQTPKYLKTNTGNVGTVDHGTVKPTTTIVQSDKPTTGPPSDIVVPTGTTDTLVTKAAPEKNIIKGIQNPTTSGTVTKFTNIGRKSTFGASKTTMYVGIGVGVLVLGIIGFIIYKKKHSSFGKRRKFRRRH